LASIVENKTPYHIWAWKVDILVRSILFIHRKRLQIVSEVVHIYCRRM